MVQNADTVITHHLESGEKQTGVHQHQPAMTKCLSVITLDPPLMVSEYSNCIIPPSLTPQTHTGLAQTKQETLTPHLAPQSTVTF